MGCDTSIIGARLLSVYAEVLPTSNTLIAANGSSILLEGKCKISSQIAGKDFSIYAVVTRCVHEFILGIDFHTKNECHWDFKGRKLLLWNQWIQLKQRDFEAYMCYVYATQDCRVPSGTQVEVPVEISRPTWRADSDCWVTESIQLTEGVLVARSLLEAEAVNAIMRVVNLTSESYDLHQNQLISETIGVGICGVGSSQTRIGMDPYSNVHKNWQLAGYCTFGYPTCRKTDRYGACAMSY